jgi:hypothetical protein
MSKQRALSGKRRRRSASGSATAVSRGLRGVGVPFASGCATCRFRARSHTRLDAGAAAMFWP